jgi:hypothetical protein
MSCMLWTFASSAVAPQASSRRASLKIIGARATLIVRPGWRAERLQKVSNYWLEREMRGANVLKGRFRIRGVNGAPNSARVADGTISFDIGEDLYRQRHYQPSFDNLPWQDELNPHALVR